MAFSFCLQEAFTLCLLGAFFCIPNCFKSVLSKKKQKNYPKTGIGRDFFTQNKKKARNNTDTFITPYLYEYYLSTLKVGFDVAECVVHYVFNVNCILK